MPGEKIIDINFELKEEKIKNEELMNILYEMVNDLNEDNKKIMKEIKI